MDEIEPSTSLSAVLRSLDAGGRGFEQLSKWILENDPEFRAQFARVWLWDDWPGRWGPDRGIDLIAETHDDALVAVQAKNYGDRHSITKRDIDTFLSESNRAVIASRLLIGSTNRVAQSAVDVMAAQEKPVRTCLLARLEASPVTWPANAADLQPAHLDRHRARPHQVQALDAIARWAQTDGSRAQVIMACGTGKSLIGVWAAERLEAARVLVLVPTLALLRQTAIEWCQQLHSPRRLLRISSDRSRLEDDVVRGDELGSLGTTDVDGVAAVLSSDEPVLVLCTYDSSPTLAAAMSQAPEFEFELVIADEAHRCAGLESSAHKTILSDDAIRARRRLFFTATPIVYGTRDKGNLRRRSVAVASMDDPARFGPVIHRLSFAEAIRRKLLCPYQVAVIPIDDDEVHALIERRRLVTADGDQILEASSLATQIACGRAMRRFGCRRVVAFLPSIKESKRFSAHFPTALALMDDDDRPQGSVWSEHVDGADMRYATRLARLARFKSETPDEHRLLCNVRMLTEGVDVPGIDAIAFVHTHRGKAAIIQAVGRAVRPAEGKTIGTIVLPIVLRKDESFQAALARSEHRHVVDILSALRSHDPEIDRSLDDLRFHAGPTSSVPPASGAFVIDAPLHVGEEFAEAVDVALTDALGVMTARRRARGRSRAVLVAEPPEPSEEEAFLIGLNELQDRGQRGLLPRVPETGDASFPLRHWWEEARRRWVVGELADYDRQAISDSLSWLSPDVDGWDDRVRREMAALTNADVCEQIGAQLGAGGTFANSPWRRLVDDAHQIDELIDQLRVVHDAITHAAMSPQMQLIYMRPALKQMVKATNSAMRGALPPFWYFMSRRQAAVIGFAANIVTVAGHTEHQPSSTLHQSVQAAFGCGTRAAGPLHALVRRMQLYRFPEDRDEVAALAAAERTCPADERLDALGWDIYLLMRARGAHATSARAQGMDGPLQRRRDVRRDLLQRAARIRDRDDANQG